MGRSDTGGGHGKEVVAGWVLDERLGSGGYAEVWRVHKPDTRSWYCL